jgi:phenylacetate-CoA oxygenase PaaH subunit
VSKLRQNIPIATGELTVPATGDLRTFEVFTQLQKGKPPVYAGTVEAVDSAMALQFGREHYGRDQPCVQVWVAPREAFLCSDHDHDVVWRLSDQSYRQARGYLHVRKKWEQFRSAEAISKYAREDLKEAY